MSTVTSLKSFWDASYQEIIRTASAVKLAAPKFEPLQKLVERGKQARRHRLCLHTAPNQVAQKAVSWATLNLERRGQDPAHGPRGLAWTQQFHCRFVCCHPCNRHGPGIQRLITCTFAPEFVRERLLAEGVQEPGWRSAELRAPDLSEFEAQRRYLQELKGANLLLPATAEGQSLCSSKQRHGRFDWRFPRASLLARCSSAWTPRRAKPRRGPLDMGNPLQRMVPQSPWLRMGPQTMRMGPQSLWGRALS